MVMDAEAGSVGAAGVCGGGAIVAGCGAAVTAGLVACGRSVEGGGGCGSGGVGDWLVVCGACG